MTQSLFITPSLRGHYAGFVTRAIAFVIDFLLVITTQIVVLLITRLLLTFFGLSELAMALFEPAEATNTSAFISFLRWVILILGSNFLFDVYLVISWLLVDRTIGQTLLGLRVVRADGRHLTLGPSIRRVIGIYVAAIPFFLGFLWVLIDDRRQGWHDKLADTVVVYDWEARLGKRLREWLARRHSLPSAQTASPNEPPSPL